MLYPSHTVKPCCGRASCPKKRPPHDLSGEFYAGLECLGVPLSGVSMGDGTCTGPLGSILPPPPSTHRQFSGRIGDELTPQCPHRPSGPYEKLPTTCVPNLDASSSGWQSSRWPDHVSLAELKRSWGGADRFLGGVRRSTALLYGYLEGLWGSSRANSCPLAVLKRSLGVPNALLRSNLALPGVFVGVIGLFWASTWLGRGIWGVICRAYPLEKPYS